MDETLSVQRRGFRDLLLVLVLLVVADGLISRFLVLNGLGLEANPFLQAMVGGQQFMLLKTAGALLVGLLLFDFYRRRPRVAYGSAALFVVLYTAIVYWNVAVVFVASGRAF